MRRDGIPYVQNPKNYYPPIDINKLSLEELRIKFIKTCGKANGSLSVCSKCQTPCTEGKRAMQLLANEVYNDPPIPLYGGKTLIERAKEENMKRRAEAEEKQKEKKPEKKKYVRLENWWEDSLKAEDQTKWVMDTFCISRTKAKSKIYNYKWNHGMVGTPAEKTKMVGTPAEKIEKVEAEVPQIKEEKKHDNDRIESKLEYLMKLQEEQKKAMEEYMKLYEQAKIEYEKIKQKTDVLCSAMDIMNE